MRKGKGKTDAAVVGIGIVAVIVVASLWVAGRFGPDTTGPFEEIGQKLDTIADKNREGRTEDVGWHPWPRPVTKNEFLYLLNAIAMVESGQHIDAVGDNGKAVGIYQIHKVYVDDLNRMYRARTPLNMSLVYVPDWFTYEDRWDPRRSRQMAKLYIAYYARKELLGHEPTLEDMARIHNGGPNGWKKESTKKYWEKAKTYLPQ